MQRGSQAASPPAAGASFGSSLPSVAFRTLSFKYHSVPAESLATRTVNRLIECGVPRNALGQRVGKRITLQGCVVLTPPARLTLPPALGGSAEFFHVSPATSSLLERAVARSPQRDESLGARARPPSPFHTPPARTSSPPGSGSSPNAEYARRAAAAAEAAAAAAEAEAAEVRTRHALRAAEDLAAQRRASLRSGGSGGAGAPSAQPAAMSTIPEAVAVDRGSAGAGASDGFAEASVTDDPPYSTAGLYAALEAAATPSDAPDIVAAAEALRVASAVRADRALAALRARRHLADFGSDLSVTARGSVSLSTKDEQVHVAAASHNHVQCAAKYPLTKRALRAKCVGRKAHEPVDPADFGVLVTGARGK